MIEYKLLGIVINNPDLYESLKTYGNIFQDNDCKHLYSILVKIYKKFSSDRRIKS